MNMQWVPTYIHFLDFYIFDECIYSVYIRYETVGALLNGTILLTSCFIMGLEAIQRIAFFHDEIQNVDWVLIVGGLGLFINLIGLCIFHDHGLGHGHSHDHSPQADLSVQIDEISHDHQEEDINLNVHGVFLHILGDLLGSVAVMLSALIIKYTDGWWTVYIDPICTLVIVSIIRYLPISFV